MVPVGAGNHEHCVTTGSHTDLFQMLHLNKGDPLSTAAVFELCLTGSSAKASPGNGLSSYFRFQHPFMKINRYMEMV